MKVNEIDEITLLDQTSPGVPPLVNIANRTAFTSAKMDELVPAAIFPAQVLRVPAEKIAGTAFFPGGSGLYRKDRDPATIRFSVGGVMILGHNFDSEFGFQESVRRGKEKLTRGTWGPLLRLLKEAHVPVDRCFFTNAYMGLCEGDDSLVYRGRDIVDFKLPVERS
jgi:hypothetical protein